MWLLSTILRYQELSQYIAWMSVEGMSICSRYCCSVPRKEFSLWQSRTAALSWCTKSSSVQTPRQEIRFDCRRRQWFWPWWLWRKIWFQRFVFCQNILPLGLDHHLWWTLCEDLGSPWCSNFKLTVGSLAVDDSDPTTCKCEKIVGFGGLGKIWNPWQCHGPD